MIFISHSRRDAASIDMLTDALDRAGLAYWIDRQEIDTSDRIQERITTGLAQCHALLAWFSADYPHARACQWEITAALAAAHSDATPTHRVFVVNPQTNDAHVHPLALRDLPRLPAPRKTSDFDTLAQIIAIVSRGIPGPLDILRQPGYPPPTHGFKPTGSQRFVSRMDELWRIHAALARNDLAQVQGCGGVGKSLLAEEYALRFGAFWPGGIFWLRALGNPQHPAESPAALAQRRAEEYSRQLADFAEALGIDSKGLGATQLRSHIGAKLDEKNERWLWIVDDLPACTRTELEDWLAPGNKGQTLVTTRNHQQDTLGHLLALDVLPPNDARALLTRDHPPTAAQEPAIRHILQRLGGHALALDIARAACQRMGYVHLLHQLENPDANAPALAAELADELPKGHNPDIAATILTGLTDLPEEGRDVLRIAAQLAAAPIERPLVAACLELNDALPADEALARTDRGMQQAVAHALAKEQDSGTPGAKLVVHTLVSRSLRLHDTHTTRQTALRHGAIEALSRIMSPGDGMRRHGVLHLAALHAAELAAAAPTAASASELHLAANLGRYEYEAARYDAAQHWLQQAFDGRHRTLGDEHPNTLSSMNNIASILYAQGDLAGALEIEKSALATRRRTLGDWHPNTLISAWNLFATALRLNDTATVKDMLENHLQPLRQADPDSLPPELRSIQERLKSLR